MAAQPQLQPVETFDTFIEGTDKARRLHQINLEKLYSKNQTIPRIREVFREAEAFNVEKYLDQLNIPPDFGIDVLTQMALHKRCTLPTMVGILRHYYEPAIDASQQTADMLLKCTAAGLMTWNPELSLFIVKATVPDDVQHDLDRFQYPLPMVVPPRKVSENEDTGYFNSRGSIILRKNHHDDDVCLDHINRVNKIRFAIDFDTASMVKNCWRHLDKPKAGESNDDFKKRVKAFEKYDRSSKEVIDLILAHGNEFYLTHRYDKRGRIYCQGYHVNYQGAPWNKAVIELADKEYVD
jgi:hypothetical protein